MHTHSAAINVSTVYRTLEVLEELGLVRHAHLSDRAPTYHSVDRPRALPPRLPELSARGLGCDQTCCSLSTDRLRAEHGFVADVGHLTVFGACVECPETADDLVTSPLLGLPGRRRRRRDRRRRGGALRLLHRRAAHARGRRRLRRPVPPRRRARQRARPADLAALADHPALPRPRRRVSGPRRWCSARRATSSTPSPASTTARRSPPTPSPVGPRRWWSSSTGCGS